MRRAKSSRRSRSIPTIRKRRPCGATSPNSTIGRRSVTRSSRISRIWCAIMSGSGSAASAATRRIKCRPRCGDGWSMPPKSAIPMSCSAPRISGRAKRRCWRSKTPVSTILFNSLKWWDFESPWLLDQYEKFRRIAPSIAFPESHDTERLVTELHGGRLSGGPDRGALPAGLCAVGRVFDRRHDADGVRVRLVAAYLGRAERRGGAGGADAVRPATVHRGRQPHEGVYPGAQRGGAAAPPVAARRSAARPVAADRERPRESGRPRVDPGQHAGARGARPGPAGAAVGGWAGPA